LQDQLARNKMSEEQVIKTIHSISNYYKTIGVRNKLKELGINKTGEFISKLVTNMYEKDDDPLTSYEEHVMSTYTPQEMIEKSDYHNINIEDYKE
jgi:alcohol dehydrogenase YqhD (iron-dependent ADH family)